MPNIKNIFAFGAGSCFQQFGKIYGDSINLYGTCRQASKQASLEQSHIEPILFDDAKRIAQTLPNMDALVISVAPQKTSAENGLIDACLAQYATEIQDCDAYVCYLSSTAVYGNHDGAMVDEDSPTMPNSARAKNRLQAEQEWQAHIAPEKLTILRLAGIYGPQRNAVSKLLSDAPPAYLIRKTYPNGEAHIFSRIHETDIAASILLAMQNRLAGIFNLCDDKPSAPDAAFIYAAQLLQQSPPPIKDFAEVKGELSAMQASFYDDFKRVSNQKIKQAGLQLQYPDYQAGLQAIFNNLSLD